MLSICKTQAEQQHRDEWFQGPSAAIAKEVASRSPTTKTTASRRQGPHNFGRQILNILKARKLEAGGISSPPGISTPGHRSAIIQGIQHIPSGSVQEAVTDSNSDAEVGTIKAHHGDLPVSGKATWLQYSCCLLTFSPDEKIQHLEGAYKTNASWLCSLAFKVHWRGDQSRRNVSANYLSDCGA